MYYDGVSGMLFIEEWTNHATTKILAGWQIWDRAWIISIWVVDHLHICLWGVFNLGGGGGCHGMYSVYLLYFSNRECVQQDAFMISELLGE